MFRYFTVFGLALLSQAAGTAEPLGGAAPPERGFQGVSPWEF